VNAIVQDWRTADITAAERALLEYAEKITAQPQALCRADIDVLRSAGWSDRAIHDAVQVISYFNYINRVADALGIAPEPDMPHWVEPPPEKHA